MTTLRPTALVPILTVVLAACSGGEPAEPTAKGADAAPQPGAAASPTSAREEAPAAPAASGADAVLLEERVVTDPGRRDMPAYRFLVPEGWELEGGVTRVGSALHMIPTMSDVSVRAPDGRGVRFWSLLEYGWADGLFGATLGMPYEGRPLVPIPSTLGEHWQRMFEHFPAEGVTRLEIVEEELLPEATELLREQLAPLYESTRRDDAQLRATGESKVFEAEARRLVIRYREGGKKIEATIFATLQKSIYLWPDGSIRAAMWNLDHAYAVFGPVGSDYANDPVLAAVVRSRRVEPAWQEAIQRWYIERGRQVVAQAQANIAAAARAAATTRSSQSQDVLDISFQGWKDRNAASDAGQSALVNAIHERTTYQEPGGTTVDLPSSYRNVFTDGQGRYVLHDDANWQINADPVWNDREWTRIEPVR
ncbi:MAG: hypothetical protein R3F34_16200 [Planctomycetota bacterium]